MRVRCLPVAHSEQSNFWLTKSGKHYYGQGGEMMANGSQFGDELSSDLSNVANGAVKATQAAIAAAKAVANLAAGNVAGAVAEVAKNGTLMKTLLIGVLISGILTFALFLSPIVLLIQLPSSIFGGLVDAMGRAADTDQLQWLIDDANMKAAADNFWGFITGNGSDPVQYIDSAASYLDNDNYDSYWSETNLQTAVLNNYFKKSYTNACTRAQKQSLIDEEIDKDTLKKQAEASGYASDKIYFETAEFTPDEVGDYQKVSFYIIALDSWKNTNTNEDKDESAADVLSRMVEVAKKVSPNGFIDNLETALGIEDEHFWVITYTTEGEAGEEVVGTEPVMINVPDPENPGEYIQVQDKNEDGTPKTRNVTAPNYTYTTTISVELNGNIREKLYEAYDIDPTETRSNHTGVFLPKEESTADTSYHTSAGADREAFKVADLIEQNVQRLMEIYGVPDIVGVSGGVNIVGGTGNVNPLTPEQLEAIKEALANESANLTDKQAAVINFAMQIINSSDPAGTAAAMGVTKFGGMCQGFITDIITLAGAYSGGRPASALDAYRNYSTGIHSTSEPPQPGSILWFNSSTAPQYGHAVLYVGGGVTLETWSSGVVISTFDECINRSWSEYIGWGFMY